MNGKRILAAMLLAATAMIPVLSATAEEMVTHTVVARDGKLIPDRLEVPAGVRLKIVVRNEGRDAIEFESLKLRKEKVLAPGAQSFIVIAPLKLGEYEFFDEFHPDTGRCLVVAK